LEITQNIVLIGMPGAGKSTIGVVLAKSLSKDFVDTDLLIQNRRWQSCQDILDGQGYLKLREFEESEILQLNVKNPSSRETSSTKLQIPARIVFGV
jgi:shikimate kinase